ncbi:cytochrome c [Pikeienuella piscinae]|uniref:Cytochrome c n=1 Tax=Pikeienuella piscinae TaxID=2748098 RepID=A0A7L5BWI0_9RHOB|nr:cytochrome c [Pikeienuella piscinae]QIE55503.1 cytochrome c [Pikeienuella piscinae]
MIGDFVKFSLAAVVALGAGAAMAQDVSKAVSARQSLMKLNAHYIGQLGAMAKGEVEYDSEQAKAAAESLAAVAALDQGAMWPAGSDSDTLGEEATEALPVIWTSYPAITENIDALADATANLAAVAGDGLEALRGGIGPVGKACGACHKEYRVPKN